MFVLWEMRLAWALHVTKSWSRDGPVGLGGEVASALPKRLGAATTTRIAARAVAGGNEG